MARQFLYNIDYCPKRYAEGERAKYYTGYSNLGVVRITGEPGFWDVYMGHSIVTKHGGIAGAYVCRCKTLQEASTTIENLIVIRKGDDTRIGEVQPNRNAN